VLMRVTKETTEESSRVLKEPLVCVCVCVCVSLEYGESRRKERTSNLEQVPRCKPRQNRKCKRTAVDLWESGESVV